MIELFYDVPDYVKIQADFWIKRALASNNPLEIKKVIDYAKSLFTDRDKDFVDFYFKMKLMEKENDENYNDFSEKSTR